MLLYSYKDDFNREQAMKDDDLYAMRHSLAHILATVVQEKWPKAKFGVGPVVDNGFYYDIDLGDQKITEEDFATLEKAMQAVIKADYPFEKFELPIEKAIDWAKETNQDYKQDLLNDLMRSGTTVASELDSQALGLAADVGQKSKVSSVSFYKNGPFTDLCRGPHVHSTGKVGVFKLLRVSGAYWRGDEKKPQLQRVYGVAFKTQKELDSYLQMLEEAKLRDHRKLGQELDLFIFSDLVGSGLPLYTPRGTIVREGLIKFSEELREQTGFQRVWSPHITKKELYETSGHWEKFGAELFLVKSQETSDELVMKPMNCPHHSQIYSSRQRSYRDLPLKYMETTTNYRDEKSGELHGLSRVRSLSQDDSHTYCQPEQVEEVFGSLIEAIKTFYSTIDMQLKVRLSYRDGGEQYLGEQKLWDFGQDKLKKIAEANKLEYYIEEGEAAFYGPKIDFMAIDAIGRMWQVATVQFDFVQPERFALEYTDSSGQTKRPIMIHCAIMGSFDRFFSVYIEHTAGRFPTWLAPEQVRLITVNQESDIVGFAEKLKTQASEAGLRVAIDNTSESVGKKIRQAEMLKVPYTIVIGQKEMESGKVTPRVRGDMTVTEDHQPTGIKEFISTVVNETKSRVHKSSF
jgi:threonyl-tRNA synthetase